MSDIKYVHRFRKNLEFFFSDDFPPKETDGLSDLSDEEFHTAWNNKFPKNRIINGRMEEDGEADGE